MPVTLDYDIASPLSPATETAIYFTVSEALTNVAKHSLAHKADVVVRERDEIRVDVEIVDDGMGGAASREPGSGSPLTRRGGWRAVRRRFAAGGPAS